MNFDELANHIENAPMTWCPALLIAIIRRCETVRCFQPGAIPGVVAKILENEKTHEAVKKEGE